MTRSNFHDNRSTTSPRLDAMQNTQYFDLQHIAQACGQSTEWILQLLEYEILAARPENRIHQFFDEDLLRAQRAYRLQRDFEASLAAVAMMMDLIDEIQQLRLQIQHPH